MKTQDPRVGWALARLKKDRGAIASVLAGIALDIPGPTYRVAFHAHCGMTTIDETFTDYGEALDCFRAIVVRRIAQDHPVTVLMDPPAEDAGRDASCGEPAIDVLGRAEASEPDGSAMVPDTAGILVLERDDSEARQYAEDDWSDPSIDVRLRVTIDEDGDPCWSILSGDSSYDTDHRGSWGSSCVVRGEDGLSTADFLIEDVAEFIYSATEV